jgi:hypothetical protein
MNDFLNVESSSNLNNGTAATTTWRRKSLATTSRNNEGFNTINTTDISKHDVTGKTTFKSAVGFGCSHESEKGLNKENHNITHCLQTDTSDDYVNVSPPNRVLAPRKVMVKSLSLKNYSFRSFRAKKKKTSEYKQKIIIDEQQPSNGDNVKAASSNSNDDHNFDSRSFEPEETITVPIYDENEFDENGNMRIFHINTDNNEECNQLDVICIKTNSIEDETNPQGCSTVKPRIKFHRRLSSLFADNSTINNNKSNNVTVFDDSREQQLQHRPVDDLHANHNGNTHSNMKQRIAGIFEKGIEKIYCGSTAIANNTNRFSNSNSNTPPDVINVPDIDDDGWPVLLSVSRKILLYWSHFASTGHVCT